ncbi:hypothetical protein DM860_001381 [Cuscuta australis]|uniref:FAR1 domain-containing protein n=1 Tax=Cuscuta australis TaxID=267555 RepID=A0A328ECE4_9ASTE|nr:hypothetical protein DM860_001381 [Cuscuta australis]
MVFQSLEDGFNFYKQYAALAGFDIRKSTNLKVSGVVVWRYVVCNREGHKHFASTCNKPTHDDGDLPKAKQRRRISNRVDCKARANIGPMKSYRLFKESVGGFNNVGATAIDFKNFKRDLKAYIAGVDAQMLIDKLFRKKQTCSAFHFDYDVDESDQLTKVFWCDPIAKKNYAMFGDVISFDATFNTNRYILLMQHVMPLMHCIRLLFLAL